MCDGQPGTWHGVTGPVTHHTLSRDTGHWSILWPGSKFRNRDWCGLIGSSCCSAELSCVVNGWCEICLWMNFNLDKMTKSNCNLCKYLCIIPGLAVYRLRDVFNLQGVGSSLLTVGIICVISNKAELLDFSDSNNNPIVSRTQLTFQRWHHDTGTV